MKDYMLKNRLFTLIMFTLIVSMLYFPYVMANSHDALVEEANAHLLTLKNADSARDIFDLANSIGPLIDRVRAANITALELEDFRTLLDDMHALVEKRVFDIEMKAEDSEAELERLFRSQDWDDISFALAAFPYWRAWIDLEIARQVVDEGDIDNLKSTALLPAQNGFRAASMQLFRPGLVYGGWLGRGYVEIERGRYEHAHAIFKNLERALAAEEESPILETVKFELRILDALTGNVEKDQRSNVFDDDEAKIQRAEAFGLLQASRKSGGRPIEAAERLRTLIGSGRVDQALIDDMMVYSQEISGVDVGVYTDLAGAEFALNYDHYYNAMQKYEAFFNHIIVPPNVDLTRYRYRWALACYNAKIYQPAVDLLEKLVRIKGLDPELDKAITKLLYAVYAAREKGGGDKANMKELRKAAQRFIRKSPEDKDTDAARLMVAQTAANASVALESLKGIKSSGQFTGDVERTAFYLIAKEFSAKVTRSKIKEASDLAVQGISAFQSLPKSDKTNPYNFAVLLEMRALIDPKPEKVLQALDSIELKMAKEAAKLKISIEQHVTLDIRRALIWSRLQLYNRLDNFEQIRSFVEGLANKGIPSWQIEFLFPFIADRSSVSERLVLARLVHASVASQPEMDRRFRVVIIEGMLDSGETNEAYLMAKEFTKEHVTSGDGWRLFAKAAQALGKPFESDRAWKAITDKAIPTMPVWWEGMISRAGLRLDSNRPDEACQLFVEAKRSIKYLPNKFKSNYKALSDSLTCETLPVADSAEPELSEISTGQAVE
jgi:tetratricopeptide (TPR) repeat protein